MSVIARKAEAKARQASAAAKSKGVPGSPTDTGAPAFAGTGSGMGGAVMFGSDGEGHVDAVSALPMSAADL
jgi:hypothetical protein